MLYIISLSISERCSDVARHSMQVMKLLLKISVQ